VSGERRRLGGGEPGGPPRGLPEHLPAGEELLWQGAPSWRGLARRAFHLRALAAYFGVLLAWLVASTLADGGTKAAAAASLLWAGPLALAALGLLAGLAWLTARTTVYTVTSRRVVMRIGVALPVTINLPFRAVEAAGLRLHADGTGDLPLRLADDGRVAYVHLWPHARPWRVARPEPMLRSVPDAARVAGILARALAAPASPAAARGAATAPAAAPSRVVAAEAA
jgi:hypothetical protein